MESLLGVLQRKQYLIQETKRRWNGLTGWNDGSLQLPKIISKQSSTSTFLFRINDRYQLVQTPKLVSFCPTSKPSPSSSIPHQLEHRGSASCDWSPLAPIRYTSTSAGLGNRTSGWLSLSSVAGNGDRDGKSALHYSFPSLYSESTNAVRDYFPSSSTVGGHFLLQKASHEKTAGS